MKKAILKYFGIFTRKHLSWSLFLIKLQSWACNFIKKETPTQFPVSIAKFLKTPVLKNIMRTAASVSELNGTLSKVEIWKNSTEYTA